MDAGPWNQLAPVPVEPGASPYPRYNVAQPGLLAAPGINGLSPEALRWLQQNPAVLQQLLRPPTTQSYVP